MIDKGNSHVRSLVGNGDYIILKRVLSVFCLFLLCLSMAGCNGKGEGSLFKYDISADPLNLDPQSAEDYNSLLVIHNIFEGLLTYTEDGKLTEGVATDWNVSDDGLEYTFTLRQDAAWSNGSPVTADDFVFAFRRLFSSDTNAPYASDFFCIKNSEEALSGKVRTEDIGVAAMGTYQLKFTLHTPNTMFLQLLTTAPAMPCNEVFFYQTKGKYGLEAKTTIDGESVYLTLCNGPLYLKQWEHNNYLALRRNEYYQGARDVAAKGVNFEVFEQPEGEEPVTFEAYKIQRFLDGETDAIELGGKAGDALELDRYQTEKFQSTTWGILINQKDAVLSNSNIRKALFRLIEPEAYRQALPSNTEMVYAIVPGVITMLDQSFRDYAGQNILPAYNAQQAKELYKKGLEQLQIKQPENVRLYALQDTGQEELFGYLSQIWQRELGFYVAVESVTEEEMNTVLKSGQFSMAFYPLSGSYNGADSILSTFTTGNTSNYAGYSSRTYDTYLTNGLQTFDMAVSAENFKNAERLLIEDGVYLPLYCEHEFFICAKGTQGILYDPQSKLAAFAYAEK